MTITASIWGPEKSAKSSLALSWPQPIVHFDFDMGFERAMYRYTNGTAPTETETGWSITTSEGGITSYRCPTPFNVSIHPNTPLKGYMELWNKFLKWYMDALTDAKVKTIVVDTATQCWQICHMAYLQEKQEAQLLNKETKLRERLIPIEYAEPNARMRAIEQAPKAYSKHLVLTHYQTDTYASRMSGDRIEEYKTGEKELDGFRATANLSDIVLRTKVDGTTPKALVTVCGLSLNMVGVELVNPTYDSLVAALDKLRV